MMKRLILLTTALFVLSGNIVFGGKFPNEYSDKEIIKEFTVPSPLNCFVCEGFLVFRKYRCLDISLKHVKAK